MDIKEIDRKHERISANQKTTASGILAYICLIGLAWAYGGIHHITISPFVYISMWVFGVFGFAFLFKRYSKMRKKLIEETNLTEGESMFMVNYESSQKEVEDGKEKYDQLKLKVKK